MRSSPIAVPSQKNSVSRPIIGRDDWVLSTARRRPVPGLNLSTRNVIVATSSSPTVQMLRVVMK